MREKRKQKQHHADTKRIVEMQGTQPAPTPDKMNAQPWGQKGAQGNLPLKADKDKRDQPRKH